MNLSGFIYLGQPIRKTAQCKSGLLYGDLKVVVCWAMALGPSFKIRNIFQSKNHLRITLLTWPETSFETQLILVTKTVGWVWAPPPKSLWKVSLGSLQFWKDTGHNSEMHRFDIQRIRQFGFGLITGNMRQLVVDRRICCCSQFMIFLKWDLVLEFSGWMVGA